MSNNVKLEKFNKKLIKSLSYIVNKEFSLTNDNIITVVSIDVTIDFEYAKVFISSLKDSDYVIKTLNNSSKKIKYVLVNDFCITKCPRLIFLNVLQDKIFE